MKISGTINASLGAFAPTPAYATLAVTTTSSRVALPTGADVIIYNTGSTIANVQLGSGSVVATTSNDAIQPGSWIEFAVGTNTNLAAITPTGSTSLVLSGGSGLATGAGGGSSGGGGGGGAITAASGSYASGALSAGAIVDLGTGASPAAYTSNNYLATLVASTTSATPVPVNEGQINGVTPLMGNGPTGTGSQRVTLASDNSALPAAGQGATGAAVPAGATAAGGKDGSGNLQIERTDSYGGMIGGTLTGTPTRTTLTASASTALPGATSTTRPSYLRVTVETTLTANLFLCLANQTCSATVYDEMIPSGATPGTRLFEEIPFTSAVTYFTTGTPTVNAARLAN